MSSAEPPEAPGPIWRLSSSIVMGVTGTIGRLFLVGANSLETHGLDEFLEFMDHRNIPAHRTRGLITVSNHLSVVDDPLMWAALPFKYHWRPDNLRWALGSHDLTFKNRLSSTYFTLGQVLPTHRLAHSAYGGLFQPTIAHAIRLLSSSPFPSSVSDPMHGHDVTDPFTGGQLVYSTNGVDRIPAPEAYQSRRHGWLHVYPEGRVHQRADRSMRYFRWGVARLILEAEPCPDLIPIWIEGFEQVMPESRQFPRFVPRPGNHIFINFGQPVDMEAVFGDLRLRWQLIQKDVLKKYGNASTQLVSDTLKYGKDAVELRKECTMRVRQEVLKLRKTRGWSEEDPKARLVDTWREEGPQSSVTQGRMKDGSWVKDE